MTLRIIEKKRIIVSSQGTEQGHLMLACLQDHKHDLFPSVFQFQMFLSQINSSLVDSNMLVRCIVLSLDRFEGQTDDIKGTFQKVFINWAVCILFFFELVCKLNYFSVSGRGAVRVPSLVLHGSSREQAFLPFQANQHHQCSDSNSGKIVLCFLLLFCHMGLSQNLCVLICKFVFHGSRRTWAAWTRVW